MLALGKPRDSEIHIQMKYLYAISVCLFLLGCTTAPRFDTENVAIELTPEVAAKDIDKNKGKSVLWGGVIINLKNLADHSQLEILAFPLSSSHIPKSREKPIGRFLIRHEDFLEPATYHPRRLVTVLGTFSSIKKGKIDEADYPYPLVESKDLHLWPPGTGKSSSNVRIGVGVRFNR